MFVAFVLTLSHRKIGQSQSGFLFRYPLRPQQAKLRRHFSVFSVDGSRVLLQKIVAMVLVLLFVAHKSLARSGNKMTIDPCWRNVASRFDCFGRLCPLLVSNVFARQPIAVSRLCCVNKKGHNRRDPKCVSGDARRPSISAYCGINWQKDRGEHDDLHPKRGNWQRTTQPLEPLYDYKHPYRRSNQSHHFDVPWNRPYHTLFLPQQSTCENGSYGSWHYASEEGCDHANQDALWNRQKTIGQDFVFQYIRAFRRCDRFKIWVLPLQHPIRILALFGRSDRALSQQFDVLVHRHNRNIER